MFTFTFARQISLAMCTENCVLLWHGVRDSKRNVEFRKSNAPEDRGPWYTRKVERDVDSKAVEKLNDGVDGEDKLIDRLRVSATRDGTTARASSD